MKKEEYARVIEWSPQWNTGAPMPHVFSNSQKIFLIYLINEPDSDWDGTSVTMVDNASETTYPLALVEFNGHTFRFGIANDEVFSGLPLWEKGLEFYAAHIIENSSWISELKDIRNVRHNYHYHSDDKWKLQKHFVLLFHDEIFEAIATDYKVEILNTTFRQLAVKVAELMTSA